MQQPMMPIGKQKTATAIAEKEYDGDHLHCDDDDDDLYIIGAVCHKSDYFAQRNFLEPSGTI